MSVTRKIIEVNESLCTGCGDCIPNCPEGALQIIDGKARLVSDLFCDGLGACVGNCPTGAMKVVEREAEPYDERRVMENIIKAGPNTIKAHIAHLRDHNETELLAQAEEILKEKGIEPGPSPTAPTTPTFSGCPGSRMVDNTQASSNTGCDCGDGSSSSGCCDSDATENASKSELVTWPVQLMLVPPSAPYFKNADLLISADCVPFAYPDFHAKFLKNRVTVIGCPKLDDSEHYLEKLTTIFQQNDIKSVVVTRMTVPCCSGLVRITEEAIRRSGKTIPIATVVIDIDGEISE